MPSGQNFGVAHDTTSCRTADAVCGDTTVVLCSKSTQGDHVLCSRNTAWVLLACPQADLPLVLPPASLDATNWFADWPSGSRAWPWKGMQASWLQQRLGWGSCPWLTCSWKRGEVHCVIGMADNAYIACSMNQAIMHAGSSGCNAAGGNRPLRCIAARHSCNCRCAAAC